jgi:hypothetical protein
MRVVLAAFVALLMAAPAFAASQITCSQIPAAQRFVSGLKPGPNTRAARHYLDAAKRAKSDRQCILDLGRVNYYAKRSAAADRRLKQHKAKHGAAKPHESAPRASQHAQAARADAVRPAKARAPAAKPTTRVKCADLLHESRPGGTDYRGPPQPSCARTF